ncbi:MAG TPA: glycosyltransferase family 39 protein, partial [Anaerolineales bacterium]|nr:glycosyltransferase family 39 protein [Anaerolineales bacterium]
FHVPVGVQARLIVNGDTVFDTYARPAEGDRAVSYPASGFNPITLEITTLPTRREYFQAGLEWETVFGPQLVPAVYLFPESVDEPAAQRAIQQSQWSQVFAWLGAVLAGLFIGAWLWEQRQVFRSRTALGLALIVLLAFSLRLIFLSDYAAQPTADVLGYGSDHRGYQSAVLDFLRGQWPPPTPFYIQPGVSLALGALYSVFGPDLRIAQLFQLALGALTSLLVFDLARCTFDLQSGWAAALLWAIFPLPIFFEAYFLTHGLEPVLGAALLWLWMRTLDNPRRPLIWILSLGLALGTATVWRPTFLLLAPFVALTLFLKHRSGWRAMIGWPLILGIATLLPILPIAWHNYKADGRFQLLTSNSDVTLYLGNNRDSTGLGEYSPAFYATHALVNQGKTSFLGQTLTDISNDPKRWAQLMIRKAALYLGDPELPNNVDFYAEGVGISPLLAALPLRFGAMMAMAMAGAIMVFPKRNNGYWLLVIYSVSQIAITIAYHVFSRFRAPIYPVLAVFAGCCVSFIVSAIRQRQSKQIAFGGVAIALSGLVIWAMPIVAESVMNRPVVAALPASAKPLNAPIGDSLTLVGHDPLPVVAPGDPFFVTLYWQSNQPITADLIGTVQLFGGELKVAQSDQMMGTGSFPDYPTSQWQSGQIVKDTYFVRMPADAPTPLALTLLVAAYYDEDTGTRLGETTFGYVPLTRLTPLELPSDAEPVNARFDSFLLNAYAI